MCTIYIFWYNFIHHYFIWYTSCVVSWRANDFIRNSFKLTQRACLAKVTYVILFKKEEFST
eukprot:UN16986